MLGPPMSPSLNNSDEDLEWDPNWRCRHWFACPSFFVWALVHAQLGPRTHVSTSNGGPVDALAPPIASDVELVAPGFSPPRLMLLRLCDSTLTALFPALPHAFKAPEVWGPLGDLLEAIVSPANGGPVDALAPPIASYVELVAPEFSPPSAVAALVVAIDSTPTPSIPALPHKPLRDFFGSRHYL